MTFHFNLTHHYLEDRKGFWQKDQIREKYRQELMRRDDIEVWKKREWTIPKMKYPKVLKRGVGLTNFLRGLLP